MNPAIRAYQDVPAYQVWIASEWSPGDELSRAVAVGLKQLPLDVHAQVLRPGFDPDAGEDVSPGARGAAVLILRETAAPGRLGVRALYDELLERTAGRMVVILLRDGSSLPPDVPPSASSPQSPSVADAETAFRSQLAGRHRTCVLTGDAGQQTLGPLIAEALGALIGDELALSQSAALDRAFADPQDAGPARIDELLGPAGTAPWLAPSAASLAQMLFASEDGDLDPLRQPARARAVEQRELGLGAFALGEYAVAARHLRAALEDLPLDLASGYWLARLQIAQGGRAACLEAARAAQRVARAADGAGRSEEAALAWVAAARAATELGQYGSAERQALEAVARAPWLAEPHIELACQRVRRGAGEGAQAAMRDAFHRDPRALLRFNRELALRGAPDLLRAWKERLRGELVEAVGVALEAEQRVQRLFADDSALSPASSTASPAGLPVQGLGTRNGSPAPEDLRLAPLLDIVAAGRSSADRTLGRLIGFAGRVHDSARDLGMGPVSRADGELLMLELGAAPEDAAKGEAEIQVLNWLYQEGERVECGRPLLRYELRWDEGRELRTLAAPRTGWVERIDIANGALHGFGIPLGALRTLSGRGVELGDRVESARAEQSELDLLRRRGERRARAETRQVWAWGLAALAGVALSAATWEAGLGFWLAPCAAVLALPALYAVGGAMRESGRSGQGQERIDELRDSIRESEAELQQHWDDFRLLADRLAQAVRVFEEAMPVDALFTPGPDWSRRAWQPGTLLRLRPSDAAAEDALTLDEQLFPPELAAELPQPPDVGRAGFYRVTAQSDGRLAAARWAVYFDSAG